MFGVKTIPSMMFSVIFLLFWVVVCPSSLEAQRRGGGPGGRDDLSGRMEEMKKKTKKQEEQQFEKLCEYLELDKKQKKEARKLFKKMQKETKKISGDTRKGKIDPIEANYKIIDTYKVYREKFRALLNQEQKMKYEKTRETGLKETGKK